jgi:hypothetical protein
VHELSTKRGQKENESKRDGPKYLHCWTTAIQKGEGNVALADGSAHRVTSKGFQNLLKTTMIVTNAVLIP